MSTIGVYDYDFFNYENVMPNLECAKLVTYYRNTNNISLLAPALNPVKYTKFIIRKDYDDGIYPRECFYQNCEYGGRAFNPLKYKPLPPKIEATIPDMHVYDKYVDHFGKTQSKITQVKRILNCAHMRLAPDSKNLLTREQLEPYFYNKPTGIVLHDYDIASLNAIKLIKEMQNSREFVTRKGINPYPIGNKFPIKIYNLKDLEDWMSIVTIPNAFFFEYNGLISDVLLYRLCAENKRLARQMYYNVSYGCSSENDFLLKRAPKIFIQSLFLRKAGVKILLTYDQDFFKTKELELFIKLLNCMISFQWQENFLPALQSLYTFCKDNAKLHYINWAFLTVNVTIEQTRDIFQYFRLNNYDLFKMFYEWDSVILKGGKFVDEWE